MTSEQKKKYTQAITNWPLKERPRERLLAAGPERLTDEDLQDRIGRHPLLEWKAVNVREFRKNQ
jgi:hypothetical protein